MRKYITTCFTSENLVADAAVAAFVFVAFMTLGFYAREFALDLQANFFLGL